MFIDEYDASISLYLKKILQISGELSGNCWLLDRLTKQEQAMFRDEEKKFSSKLKSQSWKASGITRDWPDGRAIFKGGVQDRLTVVINGEEHLALCLSIYDGNLKVSDNRIMIIMSLHL